ncbi:hypothetical protein L3Y34_011882 [Caenorhabditis briggsae]|uniref:Uncharacterized protein n=1 Tax=Caenorhabditis briggsae TaxID=6238 RepID=A0AAE9CV09_CAEBR|nr:hypothetical protein L3Y34_011882 [Caenorhabditis briggsae]
MINMDDTAQASTKKACCRSNEELREIQAKAKEIREQAEQELKQLKLSGFRDAIDRSTHLLKIVPSNPGDSKKEREYPINLKCLLCSQDFERIMDEKPTDQLTNHMIFGHGERSEALRVPVDSPAFEYLDLFGCELRFDRVPQSSRYWFECGPLDRNGADVDIFIDFSPYIKTQNYRSEEPVMKRLIAWNYGEREFVKCEYFALAEKERQKIAETLKIRESFDELWAVLETHKVNVDYQLIKKERKESKQTKTEASQTTSTE